MVCVSYLALLAWVLSFVWAIFEIGEKREFGAGGKAFAVVVGLLVSIPSLLMYAAQVGWRSEAGWMHPYAVFAIVVGIIGLPFQLRDAFGDKPETWVLIFIGIPSWIVTLHVAGVI